MNTSLCECGHPFDGSHRTPGTECAELDCKCGRFKAAPSLFDHTDCMCIAFDADSDENGWRPCPSNLCERDDHHHHPDWLVTFAHKVAVERETNERQPGHVFCVMLNRREAEGLLDHIMELVPGA